MRTIPPALRGTILLFALSLTRCATTPSHADVELGAIVDAERSRDANATAIARALGAEDSTLRIAALRALARIAEAGTSSIAAPLLDDPDPEVARWAAFALGEIGDRVSEQALTASLKRDTPARDRAVLALGRSGTASTAMDIAPLLESAEPTTRAAAGLALGLLAKRFSPRFDSKPVLGPLSAHVGDRDRNARFAAIYALMRIGGPEVAASVIPALVDSDPEIRMTAVRALADARVKPKELDVVVADEDLRVRVETARTLGAIARASREEAPAVASRLVAMVHRERRRIDVATPRDAGRATQVLLAIADAAIALGSTSASVLAAIDEAVNESTAHLLDEHGADFERIACAAAFARDRVLHQISLVRTCGGDSIPSWRRQQFIARLLGARGDAEAVRLLIEMTRDPEPRTAAAAADTLATIPPTASGFSESVAALVALLDSNDRFVVAAAAEGLAQPETARLRPVELGERLARALERAIQDPDAGTSSALIDAIGSLGAGGRTQLSKLEALSSDPRASIRRRAAKARQAITGVRAPMGRGAPPANARCPERVVDRPRIALETERGAITIELFGDVAPIETQTIVSLVKSGFYNHLLFHRVVPGFVLQGGCPRGDGWGGPGYSLDEEVSPAPFARGTVGIATSGRDTGGSQFFIVQSRQPHLDGGYSVIGEVVGGLDVLDAIVQDDAILEATVLLPDAPIKAEARKLGASASKRPRDRSP